jgi:hypothetical protein
MKKRQPKRSPAIAALEKLLDEQITLNQRNDRTWSPMNRDMGYAASRAYAYAIKCVWEAEKAAS